MIKALRGILGNKYVNENTNLLRYCINDVAGKSLFVAIMDAINSDMTSKEVQSTIEDLFKHKGDKASKTEYKELYEKFSKIYNGYYRRVILTCLDYEKPEVIEFFGGYEADILWNSSYEGGY